VRFKLFIEGNRVAAAVVPIGKIHHPLFQICERNPADGRLLRGLTDEEILRFADSDARDCRTRGAEQQARNLD